MTFNVINPATGASIGTAPDANAADAQAAIDRSVSAFPAWKAKTAFERGDILRRWRDLILRNEDAIARLMTSEMGKPITESRGEVKYAAGFVDWYAEEGKRAYGDIIPTHAGAKRLLATRQPVGPVYAVTPWNFPAAMVTRKVAPALAAGCTVVLKPAEQSPLTAVLLAQLWVEAGGAADVFQVLTTADPVAVSEPFFADARVRKLTFTGSTEVGKLLYAQAARTVKRVSLELGGHAPFLVFEDADIAAAVTQVMATKFRNAGQTCVCANRMLVQEGVYDEFVAKLAKAAEAMKVGDGTETGVAQGPLINKAAIEKVETLVGDAVKQGAKVLTGGTLDKAGPLFYRPSVVGDVTPDMEIVREEIFGPVAALVRFDTEADAIRLANDTPFGLAAYLFSRNLSRAWRVAEKLDAGMVGVNEGIFSNEVVPFGGVKESGLGREGAAEGLEEYLEIKYICLGAIDA